MTAEETPEKNKPMSHVAREAAEREARLVEAMRANLRRRKEQARGRDDADDNA